MIDENRIRGNEPARPEPVAFGIFSEARSKVAGMLKPVAQPLPARPRLHPPLREVAVESVVDEFSGGTQSRASVVKIEGEKKFLKSQEAHGYGRYANFEADLLGHDLFELIGIRSPEAEVVRLRPESPLREELGPVVLCMDYVDSEFAGHHKVAPGAWGLREGAVKDDYLKMTLVDILLGNADRRGANYFDVWNSTGKIRPVPIDNNSGLGNLVNWKTATNHCNFIPSYSGAGETPGIRQGGTIANILMDTTLYSDILDEPDEQQRLLELAREFAGKLSDQKIAEFVDRLPPEIIPPNMKVDFKGLEKVLGPESLKLMANGATEGLSGDDLFEFRRQQIKETLAWRRDHLVQALEAFFAAKDPIRDASEDWKMLGQPQ